MFAEFWQCLFNYKICSRIPRATDCVPRIVKLYTNNILCKSPIRRIGGGKRESTKIMSIIMIIIGFDGLRQPTPNDNWIIYLHIQIFQSNINKLMISNREKIYFFPRHTNTRTVTVHDEHNDYRWIPTLLLFHRFDLCMQKSNGSRVSYSNRDREWGRWKWHA